ncbi:MAG: hypothetical protein QM791_06990 [Ferruginibacter sp.]
MNTLFCNGPNVKYSLIIDLFKRRFDVNVSEQFISCADRRLTDFFVLDTGIKPGKNVGLTIGNSTGAGELEVVIGELSYCELSLFVNHDWFPVIIKWVSKSGRIYKMEDADIDCNDIVFSFESLDTDAYLKQLYPDTRLPFKLKDLSFVLKVTRINLDCTIRMQLKPGAEKSAQAVIEKLYAFIGDYNVKSEKENRKEGVIHNATIATGENDDELVMDIDLGSVGALFFKKLLTFMSDMDCFEEVELE